MYNRALFLIYVVGILLSGALAFCSARFEWGEPWSEEPGDREANIAFVAFVWPIGLPFLIFDILGVHSIPPHHRKE